MTKEQTKDQLLCGGWTAYHELTKEDQLVFDVATKGITGVDYVPYLVSTQVVEGINYRFKCRASLPKAEVMWEAVVQIYAPLERTPFITHIYPI